MPLVKQNNCYELQFTYSPNSMWVSTELVELLGGESQALKTLLDGDLHHMWPRRSSRQHPWMPLDYELKNRNVAMGQRHWVYNPQCISGNTSYHGYGHNTPNGFQFYDWNPERKTWLVAGRKTW